jgi:hypothetical protein
MQTEFVLDALEQALYARLPKAGVLKAYASNRSTLTRPIDRSTEAIACKR